MTNQRLANRESWSALLLGLARPVLEGTPLVTGDASEAAAFIRGFADERGHRRRVDEPMLAAMLGLTSTAPAPAAGPDVALWALLTREDPAGSALLAAIAAAPVEGPVTPRDDNAAIEAWTEAELSSLHALSHHAERHRGGELGAALAARVEGAVRWHTATLQPDNGTNHPWAVHVFAAYAVAHGDAAAMVHAQTLVNICCVMRGRPDRLSACILLDAGRALQRGPSGVEQGGPLPNG